MHNRRGKLPENSRFSRYRNKEHVFAYFSESCNQNLLSDNRFITEGCSNFLQRSCTIAQVYKRTPFYIWSWHRESGTFFPSALLHLSLFAKGVEASTQRQITGFYAKTERSTEQLTKKYKTEIIDFFCLLLISVSYTTMGWNNFKTHRFIKI